MKDLKRLKELEEGEYICGKEWVQEQSLEELRTERSGGQMYQNFVSLEMNDLISRK